MGSYLLCAGPALFIAQLAGRCLNIGVNPQAGGPRLLSSTLSGWKAETRQVRCPVLSFVPSLTILPLYMYSLHPSCAGVCPSPGKELAGPVDCRLQAGTPRIGRGSWLSCSKAPAVPRATGGTHGNTENTRAPLCLLHLTVSQ